MSAVTPIIEARGLAKSFGSAKVLHGVDLTIPPGRIYGLVGHNGAGKTTTLNALLGLIPCEGEVSVLGMDPFKSRADLMLDVAFISDIASLPRFLRVRELLDLVEGLHRKFSRARAVGFLEGTEITSNAKIRTLSKGMIAQLHLAVAMAIDARLLVLDEPTLGLDIIYRKRFYKRLLEDYMNEERTLLITTHQVEEIEPILTDILFLRSGHLILDMPMERVGATYHQVAVSDDSRTDAEALSPIYTETRLGQTVMIFGDVEAAKLAPLGTVSTPSLSDLFVALMQRETPDSGATQ